MTATRFSQQSMSPCVQNTYCRERRLLVGKFVLCTGAILYDAGKNLTEKTAAVFMPGPLFFDHLAFQSIFKRKSKNSKDSLRIPSGIFQDALRIPQVFPKIP